MHRRDTMSYGPIEWGPHSSSQSATKELMWYFVGLILVRRKPTTSSAVAASLRSPTGWMWSQLVLGQPPALRSLSYMLPVETQCRMPPLFARTPKTRQLICRQTRFNSQPAVLSRLWQTFRRKLYFSDEVKKPFENINLKGLLWCDWKCTDLTIVTWGTVTDWSVLHGTHVTTLTHLPS